MVAEPLNALILVGDDMNLRALFAQGGDRLRQFHLLDAIGGEHRDHPPIQP